MAGQYNNMIKELIIQTDINAQLLNEVNNHLDNDDFDFAQVKENHVNRIDRLYASFGFDDLPIYDYFDGTQLINSLFSTVVVPVEYLKGKFNRQNTDDVLRRHNPGLYSECIDKISRLHDIIDTYHRTQRIGVFSFFIHLRNALCHSGNGNIHFFPNGGRDITHLYFYDDKDIKNDNGLLVERKVFLAQINILDELIPLVCTFDKLVMEIALTDNRQLDIEAIELRIREAEELYHR